MGRQSYGSPMGRVWAVSVHQCSYLSVCFSDTEALAERNRGTGDVERGKHRPHSGHDSPDTLVRFFLCLRLRMAAMGRNCGDCGWIPLFQASEALLQRCPVASWINRMDGISNTSRKSDRS